MFAQVLRVDDGALLPLGVYKCCRAAVYVARKLLQAAISSDVDRLKWLEEEIPNAVISRIKIKRVGCTNLTHEGRYTPVHNLFQHEVKVVWHE